MAETSIAWCGYTHNGWIGCEKVSMNVCEAPTPGAWVWL